jgi:hypothetical protein
MTLPRILAVRALPCLALLMALASGHAAAADGATEREIDYLLGFVEKSGCVFVRNGTEHDSADAADHLRLKYSRGSRYVNSAEQFIDRLASESSWSGEPYTVTCDGRTETAGAWLHRALADYRESADQGL